jgi:hypothetical protein
MRKRALVTFTSIEERDLNVNGGFFPETVGRRTGLRFSDDWRPD